MYSERVSFEGSLGQTISGRLEHPIGRFGGWAIFAHCFTCSKQSRAAVALSRALAQHGIGVLRFDFTGIGESEGEFADTDFSSNVADIHAAASWMAGQGRPVSLLVGHSLGGTASIVAASGIDTLKALVTSSRYKPVRRRRGARRSRWICRGKAWRASIYHHQGAA